MRKGTELFWRLRGGLGNSRFDPEEYADRIIILTDAMPNTGETREEEMRISSDGMMRLKVTYRDQEGKHDGDEAEVETGDEESEFYQGSGIRKAILLSRYGDLLKNWLIDMIKDVEGEEVQQSVTLESGIVVPVKLGKWEHRSIPLHVSDHYKNRFELFGAYFNKEMKLTIRPEWS